jgi:hypothetical protein
MEWSDPALAIGPLRLWLTSPPNSEGWLGARARVGAQLEFRVSLYKDNVLGFLSRCQAMYDDVGEPRAADLGIEPEFALLLTSDKFGTIKAALRVSDSAPTEMHQYWFDVDQSYLPRLIAALRSALEEISSQP